MSNDRVVSRLLQAPFGHMIRRDNAGNSHVTLFTAEGKMLPTLVAPTFDEAVTRALDIAEQVAP